jgi:glycosyltransferase involved in cell wall biosynthesis
MGVKLVINIPCYNEERTLPLVLRDIPKRIPGVGRIEVQVVDDGSRDRTAAVAREHGCVVISHKRNLGLGVAFRTGVEAALARGCDILVNTDGDNQYPSRFIPDLIRPVMAGRADIVVGNRRPWRVRHFSATKRVFQYVGNAIARRMAGVRVPDVVSGFRAYSREALLRLNITTRFSYVLDTLVQAGKKGLAFASVPVQTNAPTRKSRLSRNIFQHMSISAANILRVSAIYEPFKTFLLLSLIFFIPAVALAVRFCFYILFINGGIGHVQSLIASAVCFTFGIVLFALGVLGDLIGINRMLLEEQLYNRKKRMYGKRA